MAEERSPIAVLLLPAAVGICLLMAGLNAAPRVETIASLTARLRLEPTDPIANEQLGNLLAQSGRLDDAIAAFRNALARNPDSPSVACGLARALADKGGTGNMLEAHKLLEASFKRHPQDAATNEALGDLAYDDPIIRSAGPAAMARIQKFYETALASEPQRARSALRLSEIYLDQSHVKEAAQTLIPALQAHPRDAALNLQKARILTLLGLYNEAADAFNTGTALDPANAEAYYAWGLTLLAAGNPETAERVLRRAVDLDPKNALYHMHYARALWKEGLTSDALNEFAKAIDKDNKCIPIYLELSSVFQEIGNENSAIRVLRLGIQADPDDLTIKVALAKLLLNARDPLLREPWEAATLLQTCVERTNRSDVTVLIAAAKAWAQVELYDKSLPLIEQALSYARVHELPPDQIEKILGLRQDYQIAINPMPQASNLTPYLSIRDFSPGHLPMDLRAPDIKSLEPTMDKLISKPVHLNMIPAPGSALDPELYSKNLKPFLAPGYRP
jgi:tetratricopeptide (TPR) repeat protein